MCRLHICEYGPSFARPLGLPSAPHRRPQGPPYFFPVRRAQNARRTFDAHARARHERAHFHPSRTSPFAMGKDKSMKDVGAAQVRAPPLARSLPPRHRPPPFPTNISGA